MVLRGGARRQASREWTYNNLCLDLLGGALVVDVKVANLRTKRCLEKWKSKRVLQRKAQPGQQQGEEVGSGSP